MVKDYDKLDKVIVHNQEEMDDIPLNYRRIKTSNKSDRMSSMRSFIFLPTPLFTVELYFQPCWSLSFITLLRPANPLQDM